MMTLHEQIATWPKAWSYDAGSEAFGEKLVREIEPFVDFIAKKLAVRTVDRHLNSLFLMGGEIISELAVDEEYDVDPLETLRNSVEDEGGPLCSHLHTEADERSYEATCRKLHRFLEARDQ